MIKKKFLKPTFYCESNSEEIKDLAKKITKNSRSQEEAVKKIFYWVRDKVCWNIVKIVGAKKVLKRNPMHAICVDKTNLFIALCRAINIPARYLLILSCELKSKRRDFPKTTGHVAAEVYLDNEWKIVDPTFGKHTKRLVPISKFKKPSWEKIKGVLRLREFSRLMVFISLFALRFSPSALKMKKLIEEMNKN
ncbi:MAG: transglutaminase-like domain-containing protein [Candidatus Aenigmatarchaeota archaeon]